MKKTTSILIVILVLALVLRLSFSGYLDASPDEAINIMSAKNWNTNLKENLISDPEFVEQNSKNLLEYPSQSIVYNFFVARIMNIGGDSLFILRAISILFSVAMIYFVFLLARYILTKNLSLLLVFLIAINPRNIIYSSLVTVNSLFTLITITAIYLALEIYNKKQSPVIDYYLFGVLLLGAYTSYFGYLLLIFCLWIAHKGIKNKIGILATVVLALPGLWSLINFVIEYGLLPYSGGLMKNPILYLFTVFDSFLSYSTELTYLIFCGFIIGSFVLWKTRSRVHSIIIIATVVLVYVLTFLNVPIFQDSFGFLIPLYLLVVVKGVIDIKDGWLKNALIAGIIIISFVGLFNLYTVSPENNWKALTNNIKEKYQPGDVILISYPEYVPVFDYYYKDFSVEKYGLFLSPDVELNVQYFDGIKGSLLKYNRIWLILTGDGNQAMLYRNMLDSDYNHLDTNYGATPFGTYGPIQVQLLASAK